MGSMKKLAIIGISSMLLVALVVAVAIGLGHKNNSNGSNSTDSGKVSASNKAISSICQTTDYKQECNESLQSAGKNVTDPKKLIQAAFQVAMKQISAVAENSTVLKHLEKDPRATKALDACKEVFGLAEDDFKKSFDRLGSNFDLTKLDEMLMDLKVWISATVTYQQTCLDAFENTTSDAGQKMKDMLQSSMHMSSNALAMVDSLASFFNVNIKDLNHGRSLLDLPDLPVLGHDDVDMISTAWFKTGLRKLLGAAATTADANKFNKAPDVVVAKDGSGTFKEISQALQKVPKNSNTAFVIYIKEGIYKEKILIEKSMSNLVLVGDGATKTRITGSLNFVDGTPTYHTATVVIQGPHFMARDIGFENSAGAEKHQAVAIRVSADEAIFYGCAFDGYQDTLYAHTGRQFYRDCTISGTIDFVFGDSSAVFQNCTFVVRKPMPNQSCIVTAQGRKERRQPTAIVIINGKITSDPGYYPLRNVNKAYLGRPWKEYSRTIIMESDIGDLIQPEGWLPWMGDFGLNTCFYSEYNNRGPGSNKAKRVTWRGIKNLTPEHALDFTPGRFFRSDLWVRQSGVPYFPNLTA